MEREWKELYPPKFRRDRDEKYQEHWMRMMDKAWESSDGIRVYSRMVQYLDKTIEHIYIKQKDGNSLTWLDKQQIKNDLFGAWTEVIEVYPREAAGRTDQGEYHLWIPRDQEKLPYYADNRKLKAVNRGYQRDVNGFMAELADIFGITEANGRIV